MAACMSGHLMTVRDTGNLPLHRNVTFFFVLVLSQEKYIQLQFKHWPLLIFISNCIWNMPNFLYALTESISLSYFKKIRDWIETKRRRKRTGTCKCWTLEQIAYLPGQKEKGLAWLFQLYRCRCWYCREIKQCDCMSNFVVEQIKLNQDIPSNIDRSHRGQMYRKKLKLRNL